jgi:hypothetical protein
MENREWLKSLSDKQLAEEIKYGRMLAESSRHKQLAARELREAEEERRRRARP